MSPSIDFGSVKGLEPIPMDTYLATIVKADPNISKAGNQLINLQWRVDGGKYDGRIIFESLTFSEKTMFRVKNTLLGLGFPKDFGKDGTGEVTSDMLVNKTAMITVDIEISTQVDPDTGEPYPPKNRVKKVQQPKAGTSAGAPSMIAGKKK